MFSCKVVGKAVRLAVNNEVDIPLAVEVYIFGAMVGYQGKAHFQ